MDIIKKLNPYTRKRLLELVQVEKFKVKDEKQFPGELGHIDIKKVRKIKGDENQKKYEILLIDDCTRISYAEIIPDKTAFVASCFLANATAYFKENYNIEFKRLMSDNGNEFTTRYKKNLSLHPFEAMCRIIKIKHIYTKPYTPKTNGKVERIWRTIDNEFYKKKWLTSPEHREEELAKCIEKYNKHRVHLGIKGMTPYQKLLKIREADFCQRVKRLAEGQDFGTRLTANNPRQQREMLTM